MTPAQELQQAAKLMRQRGEASSAGPWCAEQRRSSAADIVLNRHGGEVADCAYVNAVYIAGMHPGVALAVADLLDGEALMVDKRGNSVEGATFDALKVARTYLGTEGSSDE